MKLRNVVLGAVMALAVGATAWAAHTQPQKDTIGTLRNVDKKGYLYEIQYKADYKFDQVWDAMQVSGAGLQDSVRKVILPDSSIKLGAPLPSKQLDLGISAMTPENHPLLAHSYHMTNDERAVLVVHTEAPGKFASVGIADMGYIGAKKNDFLSSVEGQEALLYAPFYVIDGVNEKGFSIATLTVPGDNTVQDNGNKKLFSALIPRYMLDNARSVQDALEKFQELDVVMPAGSSYHWLLNDAYGDSAVVEYVRNTFVSQPKAYVDKHQVVANYWLNPMVAKDPAERGMLRTKLLRKFFKKNKYPTEQQLMDQLEQARATKEPELTKKGSDLTLATNWSVVYDLEKRIATICFKEDYNNRYGFRIKQLR
ncbi:MAG: linear amide C-N hydrolase [Acidaminococcaceae bacterium]|nr:linear amide C-N hydrolase [Acidaminococcaceae bacterium]